MRKDWHQVCQTLWEFDRRAAQGVAVVAGVDEAGRGCLAGPVVAAAVILGGKPEDWVGINDSKQLTKARRAALCQHITASAVAVAVGVATVAEIDHLNILVASRVAMGRAIAGLPHKVDTALVDGPYAPLFPADEVRAIPVVDGDAKSLSIAAASIVAKVERDAMMAKLAEQYPMYGFERHVGYGTSEHLAALRQYGPTPHHRTTFGPVKALIEAR